MMWLHFEHASHHGIFRDGELISIRKKQKGGGHEVGQVYHSLYNHAGLLIPATPGRHAHRTEMDTWVTVREATQEEISWFRMQRNLALISGTLIEKHD